MPLHLLGKKSWNVYNADNIARVRRDEAAARAQEEAEEQRMQEVDAVRRLAILRGEVPPPLEDDGNDIQKDQGRAATGHQHSRGPPRKKRKRAGEDDTDFEMRLVRENAEAGDRVARELAVASSSSSAAAAAAKEPPLVDAKGHILLFNEEPPREKNADAEREAAKKRRELEDQHQMRFADAAGRGGGGGAGPWYVAPDDGAALVVPSKNVFGREDPGRKGREAARLGASDPLAMMKMGAAKVRELDKGRRVEAEEREREVRAMRKEERRRDKERRRRRGGEDGDGSQGGERERRAGSSHERHHDEDDRRRGEDHRHRHGGHRSEGRSERDRHGERDRRDDGRRDRRRSRSPRADDDRHRHKRHHRP